MLGRRADLTARIRRIACDLKLSDKCPPQRRDSVDDSLILLLGIGAIVWYLRNGNRYARSLMPIFFVGVALLIFAIIVEIADPKDVGDDFGGLVLFALATAFLIFEYVNAPKKAEAT